MVAQHVKEVEVMQGELQAVRTALQEELAEKEQAMAAQHAKQVEVIQGELQAVRTALQEKRLLSSQRAQHLEARCTQLEAQVRVAHFD